MHEIWVKEKMKRFKYLHRNWGLQHWCTGRSADKLWHFLCACAVVFPLEEQRRWLWHHEMTSQWSLMLLLKGTIKREHIQTFGTVVWVFGYWTVGSIDKSQTLYSGYLGVSCGTEHNQNKLCALFVHMHVPRLLGETFSQYDFSCLMLAG